MNKREIETRLARINKDIFFSRKRLGEFYKEIERMMDNPSETNIEEVERRQFKERKNLTKLLAKRRKFRNELTNA